LLRKLRLAKPLAAKAAALKLRSNEGGLSINPRTQPREAVKLDPRAARCLSEPKREATIMPLLFYFPIIILTGLWGVHGTALAPAKAKARR
jgi:hypothetical protein